MVRWWRARHAARRSPGHRSRPRAVLRRARGPGVLAGPALPGLRGDALARGGRRTAAHVLALRCRRPTLTPVGVCDRLTIRRTPPAGSTRGPGSGGIGRIMAATQITQHPSGPRPRVLLVDDDVRIGQALGLALDDEGFDVDAVHTGEEALERAGDPGVDLVLLDLMLPGIDGFTVCRRLREAGDLPIIMVTARSDSADVITGLEAEAEDYVANTLVAGELAARIRALLRRRPPSQRPVLGDVELRPTRGSPCPRRSLLAGLSAAARSEDALACRKRRLHVHGAAGVCDRRGTRPVVQGRAMASCREPGLLVPGSRVASVNAVYVEHHTPRIAAGGSYDVHMDGLLR